MAATAKKLPIRTDSVQSITNESILDASLDAALRGEYLSVLREPIPPRLKALIQRLRMIESAAPVSK